MTDIFFNYIFIKNNFIYWYIGLIIIALFNVITGLTNFFWLKKLPKKTKHKLITKDFSPIDANSHFRK